MKLIGNGKKDYFDYLIHQYGEDPLTILDRRPIGEFIIDRDNPAIKQYKHTNVGGKFIQHSNRYVVVDTGLHNWGRDYNIRDFLVVNGKGYPIVKVKGQFQLADDSNSEVYANNYYRNVSGDCDFTEVCKIVKRHSFIIEGCHVHGVVPNLGELGFAKIKSAHEVYLETIDFINQHFVKEAEVSIPQTNKEKIVGHGFDIKTSFRGK